MNDGEEIARNKETVRGCIEQVWNAGRLELIPELVEASFRGHHERDCDRDTYGLEGFTEWMQAVRAVLPDLDLRIRLIFAEADRVMVHLAGSGTYGGTIGDAPPATRALTFTATGVFRLARGKIAECWVIYDTLGILQQLGVVAPLG